LGAGSVSARSRWRALRAARRARGALSIADGVRIDAGVRIEVERGARLSIGSRCHLEPHVRVFVRGGLVEIGDGAVLGERSTVVALRGITLGQRARLGAWATVMDFTPSPESSEIVLRETQPRSLPVEIGADAVIEAHAVVEAGARIAAGARVPAGTVLAGEQGWQTTRGSSPVT
jgi:acetyltransferase-like isoleucine patch superfamily enzyme